jgi:hypothetical protein
MLFQNRSRDIPIDLKDEQKMLEIEKRLDKAEREVDDRIRYIELQTRQRMGGA